MKKDHTYLIYERVICVNLSRTFDLFLQIIDKNDEQNWAKVRALGTPALIDFSAERVEPTRTLISLLSR